MGIHAVPQAITEIVLTKVNELPNEEIVRFRVRAPCSYSKDHSESDHLKDPKRGAQSLLGAGA